MLAGWLADRLAEWLADRLAEWLADQAAGWQAGRQAVACMYLKVAQTQFMIHKVTQLLWADSLK